MLTFGHSGHKPNWVRRNCIGKGSFGLVNLAIDQSDNDGFMFAVKSVEQNSHKFVRRCLENEIRILKSLSSPYIVSYLGDDVTVESSSVYRNLHMEYMPGGTLADVAKRGADAANIRTYTRCITTALNYIHAHNIVHCDVKGTNVLIGNTPDTAKLADFGSAIELGVQFVEKTRGTPQWMAPEVIRGEYIGPESDVWSLGCTVIEILTGKPAWQDRGADTIRQIGYSDEVPEIPSRVPEDLRDFLEKCLKRNPSERWSCDQLLQHPFLLPCSLPSSPLITTNKCKLSPRCVFDWPDSNSSNESTVESHEFHMNISNAKQRIGKLASSSRVNWETEGWETVRHVTVTEYSDSGDGEESVSVSGSGRVNWEDEEFDGCCDYGFESTSSDARSIMVGGMYRESVDRYMYIWIEKLFSILYLINSNVIRQIHYTQWFNFNAKSCFFQNSNSNLWTRLLR
ncbi:mitogen-activated protein kinase kinase kinase 18-like [Bidens hawaiensis]|uniref:mitogen-activated protein kinase kinase kinase 18-like n=1 Tax=Bidens hawaiensis TaxID=980011 RepID=UPI00404A60E1